jgi:thiamine-phosphate pyrophosphorylase
MKPLSSCRLYGFVDTGYLDGRDPDELARVLCGNGVDLLQYRAKGASVGEVRRVAERLLPVCEAAGVYFVVNDHPVVAKEIGAHICHLGQEDFFDAGHRFVADVLGSGGGRPLLGLSSHAPEQAERAVGAGAAYVAVGPVFATPTKPGRLPVTMEYVRWAAANLSVPWFAIGGIDLGNLDELLEAGARRVCVVSAILRASDVGVACREFRRRLDAC